MELKSKLTKALFLAALVVSSLLFLLILFQPTNVNASVTAQTQYSSLFGWTGLIFSLPVAWFLVKDHLAAGAGKIEKVFHYIGVYGTRLCVVAIMWVLFAIAGYVIPGHIVNMSAFETYTQEVELVEFRVSTGSEAIKSNRPWYSFPDEFLIIQYSNGRKVPLYVNNSFGTNKLSVAKVIADKYEQAIFPQGRNSVIKIRMNVTLIGRRHLLGQTIDSISLRK